MMKKIIDLDKMVAEGKIKITDPDYVKTVSVIVDGVEEPFEFKYDMKYFVDRNKDIRLQDLQHIHKYIGYLIENFNENSEALSS